MQSLPSSGPTQAVLPAVTAFAVVCDGQRLSYRELTVRSEQVAQHLVAAGIGADETVGLYLANSVA